MVEKAKAYYWFEMEREERRHRHGSVTARAVWPLLFLTAGLHAYVGLSTVAYVVMGVSNPASGLGGWTVAATGGLQAVAAGAAFVLAARRDLRGTTLAIAGSIVLGWLSMVPSVLVTGLDFRGDDRVTPLYFVVAPLIAMVAASLARRNAYPIAAALVATATTVIGILVVIAFAIVIALYGF